MVIKDPDNDEGYLVICDDLFVNEEILTSMIELAHDSRRDISQCENWNLGRRALLDSGHWGFVGRHDTKESNGSEQNGHV
jgi:hypothetical protein